MTNHEHDLKLGDKYIHEIIFFDGFELIRKEYTSGYHSWYYSYHQNIECLCALAESILFENEYQKFIKERSENG